MAQVRIKNLTQHRIYVPVPVGIMMRPAQEVILSEVSDDSLAQSKKISNLVDRGVIQVWIQPQDPEINDTLETRFINVGGGLPLHGSTHYDGGSDPIDVDQLRTSGGIPGYLMVAGPGGSISWQPHTVPAHSPNHAHGGSDELDVSTLASTTAPAAGYLAASDGANGLAWVSPTAPGAHKATHYEGGSDSIDVADLSSASAAGADQLVRSDGAGGLDWTSPGTPGAIEPDDTAAPGTATTYSRSDHRHAITADTPGTIQPDDTAAEGTATSFTRSDHRHAISADVPIAVTPGDPALEGASTSFSRADHQHSVPAFAAPGTIEPDATSDAGTAGSFSRSDHRHAIDAATPGTIQPDDTAAEGTSTSFSRADHTHAIVADTPGTIQPDDAAAEGAATSFSRSDHTHAITAAAPSQGVGGGNQEGAATSFSRSDHDHTVRETGGPQDLTVAAIPDGYSVRRSGTTLAGVNPYDPARTIVVAKEAVGADATNIADGITAANALTPAVSAPVTILVHPGVYSTAPFTLPNYVSLVGVGHCAAVILDASTATAALCTVGGEHTVRGVMFRNANGVGGVAVATNATSATSTPIVEHCRIQNCTTGVSVVGTNYTIELNRLYMATGTTGLLVNGTGATANIDSMTLTGLTYGVDIGLTGGDVYGVAYVVRDAGSFTYHIRVQAAGSTLQLMPSIFRSDKTSYHPSATIQTTYGSPTPGDEAYKIIGEFHVGSEARPRESAFGGGDSHTRGMSCLTNTNGEAGTWANITSPLLLPDATTTAVFAGTAAANCFYIGGDYEFPGIKALVTTALVGGAVVLEYWNGTAWVTIPHVSCDSDSPYSQYAQAVFQRVSSEQVRFGTGAITGWATKSLNGITKYWVRWRITTALTTVPVLDHVKVHTDRTEINGDGIVEYFGAAEPVRQLIWHRSLLEELEGFAQPDIAIDIATNFSVKALSNRWQDGNKDGSATFLQALPGLDTSRPLIYVVGWAPETTGTGNIELQLDVVTLGAGSVLDGTVGYTQQLSQVVTGPFNTAFELQVTQFSFTVPDLASTGTLAMALYRDAGGGNLDDTFVGNAMHVYSAVYGTFWR